MKLFKIITLIGILLLAGTAGASDLSTLDFKSVLQQGLLGCGLLLIGAAGMRCSGKPKQTKTTAKITPISAVKKAS